MQRLFKVLPAPRPDDVNWPALQRSWWQRTVRRGGGVGYGHTQEPCLLCCDAVQCMHVHPADLEVLASRVSLLLA